MASLIRDRARKPVEKGVTPLAGTGVVWHPEEGSLTGQDTYRLIVGQHEVHLDEDEMLDAVNGWLEAYRNRRRAKHAKSARHP